MKMLKKNAEKIEWNWLYTNPFFYGTEEYESFKESLLKSEEENGLPIKLEYEPAEDLNMNDIKMFSQWVGQDTNLFVEFNLLTCDRCGRLHCYITLDAAPITVLDDCDDES